MAIGHQLRNREVRVQAATARKMSTGNSAGWAIVASSAIAPPP
jgi:hypothetical protein